jgi:hypothetical protein
VGHVEDIEIKRRFFLRFSIRQKRGEEEEEE